MKISDDFQEQPKELSLLVDDHVLLRFVFY